MIKKWLTVIGKTILLLIGITFLSFLLVYHSPGDPAMVALKKSGMRVSEKALELKREELGLNDPFAVQYGRWLNEFFHGDLGESYKTGKAVAGELKKTIPATLLLTVAALALTILISFPGRPHGVSAAYRLRGVPATARCRVRVPHRCRAARSVPRWRAARRNLSC